MKVKRRKKQKKEKEEGGEGDCLSKIYAGTMRKGETLVK